MNQTIFNRTNFHAVCQTERSVFRRLLYLSVYLPPELLAAFVIFEVCLAGALVVVVVGQALHWQLALLGAGILKTNKIFLVVNLIIKSINTGGVKKIANALTKLRRSNQSRAKFCFISWSIHLLIDFFDPNWLSESKTCDDIDSSGSKKAQKVWYLSTWIEKRSKMIKKVDLNWLFWY